MILYLMRHGHAENQHPDGDAGRQLTPEGKQTVQRGAEALRGRGVTFDQITASPYRRAAETAAIVANATGYGGEITCDHRLVPSGRFEEVSDLIREHSGAETLLLAGHQPLIGETAAWLTAQGNLHLAVPPGTIIIVEITGFRPHAHGVLLGVLSQQNA